MEQHLSMSKQNNLQTDSSVSFKMAEIMSAASEYEEEEEDRISKLEENKEKISKLECGYELQAQLKEEEQKVELAQSKVRSGV